MLLQKSGRAPIRASPEPGVASVREAVFRLFWPFRAHVCRPAVNHDRREVSTEIVWLLGVGLERAALWLTAEVFYGMRE